MLGNFILALGAVSVVSAACSYHVGWNHGWKFGYADAVGDSTSEVSRKAQPDPRTIFHFGYCLGWHHGWDYGFRDGLQKSARHQSKN